LRAAAQAIRNVHQIINVCCPGFCNSGLVFTV